MATTLLAGDATAPGLELAARYGLPADAYRVRDRQVLASLQWTRTTCGGNATSVPGRLRAARWGSGCAASGRQLGKAGAGEAYAAAGQLSPDRAQAGPPEPACDVL